MVVSNLRQMCIPHVDALVHGHAAVGAPPSEWSQADGAVAHLQNIAPHPHVEWNKKAPTDRTDNPAHRCQGALIEVGEHERSCRC